MATAEDDEMVLQEVKVEQTETQRPTVERSFSLQIPETSVSFPEVKEPTTAFNIRRGLSPKIAPKFPREKLKSMFRKRRLSSAFPFYKLKGVRFSRDTKDDDESVNQSLLDVSYQEPEVEITLSTPELTETEKETGVHPYYYTQQITSAKQLATGKAFLVRQTDLQRYGSEEEKMSKGHQLQSQMTRASSLPIIQQSDTPSIRDPIIALSLKKISEVMKTKQKVKKKRSPPPQFTSKDKISTDESQDEPASDTESLSRRNTLPQIMVTRYGQKASEHLDLATAANSSGHSSGCSSDSGKLERPSKRVSVPPGKEKSSEASSPTYVKKGSVSPEKTFRSVSPESHSTSKSAKKASPQQARIVETAKISTDDRKLKSHPRKKSPPPPKRPETLVFAKSSFTPSKKIAGISLKSTKPSSPTLESTPSSPSSDIPQTPSKVGRSPSFPKPGIKPIRSSTGSPKRSPTTESNPFSTMSSAQADTSITISDSREDIREMSDQKGSQPISPPEPPQCRIPRANIKGKK
ncbi:proteoglycan 4-like [Stegodyphus dumicola]|uniref:proteoglycan 4-like n=1 Tax=Stegodyphus dumicola TaxID=202533 RepID=UPI0015AC6082|nr:proteoglycan 4-like [Stegodyphus dumicola]